MLGALIAVLIGRVGARMILGAVEDDRSVRLTRPYVIIDDPEHWKDECIKIVVSMPSWVLDYIVDHVGKILGMLSHIHEMPWLSPDYYPRSIRNIETHPTPLQFIYEQPIAAKSSINFSPPLSLDYIEAMGLRNERTIMLNYFMSRYKKDWKIIDQNSFTDNSEDLYTGCWFDFAIVNALHYYPKIAKNMCALLKKHYIDDNVDYNSPKDVIRALRLVLFIEVEQQFRKNPKVRRLIRAIVFYYIRVSDNRDLDTLSLEAHELFHKYMKPDGLDNVPDDQYVEWLKTYGVPVIEEAIDNLNNVPEGKKYNDDNFLMDIWMKYIYQEMITSNGANPIYTQLIALIFNFTCVDVRLNTDKNGYESFMWIIHKDPHGAYVLLLPRMQVQKIINEPEPPVEMDERTMIAFSMYDEETRRGHAMFITYERPLMKWNYAFTC